MSAVLNSEPIMPGYDELQDDVERKLITDQLDQTLFVNAGAGSGKSTNLVKRIINLVLIGPHGDDPVPIIRIAAITFTEKAGAELRVKLRNGLNQQLEENRDTSRGDLAQKALDDLDGAAIGTIHAFARRVLAEHGLADGIPPAIEIVDAIGESVAFDKSWPELRDQLLNDEDAWREIEYALDLGFDFRHLKALAKVLDANWDIIEQFIPSPDSASALPDLKPIIAEETQLFRKCEDLCSDKTDKLFQKVVQLHEFFNKLNTATELKGVIGNLEKIKNVNLNVGSKNNWNCDLAVLRGSKKEPGELYELCNKTALLLQDIYARALNPVIYRVAQLVLERAKSVEIWQLQFNDQIILARDLVTKYPQVRQELQNQYHHIFLDEFQDTDPLQIELAARIAGGASANQLHWQSVTGLTPGSLFFVGDAKQSIYKFRRANIATYLAAQQHFSGANPVILSTNFRTVAPIVNWVNSVMDGVKNNNGIIKARAGSQPDYQYLVARRKREISQAQFEHDYSPAVTVIGAEALTEKPKADDGSELPTIKAGDLRDFEAADVAAVICQAVNNNWQVADRDEAGDIDVVGPAKEEVWRDIQLKDIVILVPAKTTVPKLTAALDKAGIPYQADAASNPFRDPNIVDLHRVIRALVDVEVPDEEDATKIWLKPADAFYVVHALRSRLFSCSDADLMRWRLAGQTFKIPTKGTVLPEDNPVGSALNYLGQLKALIKDESLTPAQIIEKLIAERQLVEIAAFDRKMRNATWRRLRLINDLARAWRRSITISNGPTVALGDYIFWVDGQMDVDAKVPEVILPETDLNAVRIMTIHSSKGLEFPMVIVSGLTAEAPNARYPQFILNYVDAEWGVKFSSELYTLGYEELKEKDDERESDERARLLYVAATRAQDHLVVSTYRLDSAKKTLAERFANARKALLPEGDSAREFPPVAPDLIGTGPFRYQDATPERDIVLPSFDEAQKLFTAAQTNASRKAVVRPSGLKSRPAAQVLGEQAEIAEELENQRAAASSGDATPVLDADGAVVDADELELAEAISMPLGVVPGEHEEPVQAVEPPEENDKGPLFYKGPNGARIGSTVHRVLEELILQQADSLTRGLVDPQIMEKYVNRFALENDLKDKNLYPLVQDYANAALASPVVQQAAKARAEGKCWPEVWVGTAIPDDWDDVAKYEREAVLEGIIDLLYQADDGAFEIVDYKTDTVKAEAGKTEVGKGNKAKADPGKTGKSEGRTLAALTEAYTPQLQAYVRAVTAITGQSTRATLLFLDTNPATAVPVL